MIIQNTQGEISEVLLERDRIVSHLIDVHSNDISFIDMYVDGHCPDETDPKIWRLAQCIQKLSGVDVVYFVKGWKNCPQCQVMHLVCELYNINFVEL